MKSAMHHVEDLLRARVPFEHIEAYIENRQDLNADQQSAVWLYAWVETDRSERRRAVGELLAGLAHALD